MLPILRILPVGGLLLAILILVLALSPPDGSRAPLSSAIVPSRGALLDRERQAEVRQFLIHAALKRADELNRLRELPDTPARSDNGQSTVASLPGDRSEADPEEPASINEAPVVSIPVEIGEPSSAELPIAALEESAPATKTPNLPPNRNGNPAAASTEYAVSEHRRTRHHLARSIFWKRCSAGRSISNPRTVASRPSSDINRCQTLPRRRTRTPFPRSLAPIPTRRLGQRKIAMSGRAHRK